MCAKSEADDMKTPVDRYNYTKNDFSKLTSQTNIASILISKSKYWIQHKIANTAPPPTRKQRNY